MVFGTEIDRSFNDVKVTYPWRDAGWPTAVQPSRDDVVRAFQARLANRVRIGPASDMQARLLQVVDEQERGRATAERNAWRVAVRDQFRSLLSLTSAVGTYAVLEAWATNNALHASLVAVLVGGSVSAVAASSAIWLLHQPGALRFS